VQATTQFRNPGILAELSANLGAPMSGISAAGLADNQRLAGRGW
jgi:pyridoxal 5'-phosphate synthase pdxS subunit